MYDLLMDRLRFALERIAKADICDGDYNDSKHRRDAYLGLHDVTLQTTAAGFCEIELYAFLVSSEEARIDFETEQAGS